MAEVSKRFGKGQLTSVPTAIYTVPAGKKAFVKAITFCVTDPYNPVLVSMKLAGTSVIMFHKIKSRDTITIPFMDQILETGEKIEVYGDTEAGTNGTLPATYYISGREVDA